MLLACSDCGSAPDRARDPFASVPAGALRAEALVPPGARVGGQRVLGVRFAVEGPPPSEYRDRPLVVMARHAGPGDSFLVVHALLNWYDREPRIVLKNTLQWDPAIDVLLNRLPNRFIAPNPGAAGDETERHIAELATGFDHDDSLGDFPRGWHLHHRPAPPGYRQAAPRAATGRPLLEPTDGVTSFHLAGGCHGRIARGDPTPTPCSSHTRGLSTWSPWDILARVADGHRGPDALVASPAAEVPRDERRQSPSAVRLVGNRRRVDRDTQAGSVAPEPAPVIS